MKIFWACHEQNVLCMKVHEDMSVIVGGLIYFGHMTLYVIQTTFSPWLLMMFHPGFSTSRQPKDIFDSEKLKATFLSCLGLAQRRP